MDVALSHIDDIAVVTVSGHLDSGNVDDFERPVLDAIDSGDTLLLMDFRECSFMSSAGIRVILIAAKRLKEAEGMLVITGLNEYITRVFEISGLPAILNIVPAYEDAMKRLRENTGT